MSLVSVVVPTYNRATFLEDAVDSVLDGTHRAVECIVVDGGSSDGTRALLESYSDDRLRTIYRDEPEGVSSARNAGLEAANGEFVAFLDSDDRLDPEAVEALLEPLVNSDERYAGVAAHERVYTDGSVTVHSVPVGRISWSDVADGNASLGGPSCTMYRAGALDRVGGFDESFPAVEDVDFHLRVLTRYDMIGLDAVLCTKRSHDAQLSDDTARMIRGYERLLEKHGRRLSPRASAARRYTIAHLHATNGRPRSARSELRRAFATYPRRLAYPFYYSSLLLGELGYRAARAGAGILRSLAP